MGLSWHLGIVRTLSSRFVGVTVVAAACAASLATMGCGKLRPKRDEAPPAAALAPQEPAPVAAPVPDKAAPAAETSAPDTTAPTTVAPSEEGDDDAAPAKASRGARASKRGHGSHRRSRDGAKGHGAEPASGAAASSGDDPYADAAPELRVVRFVVAKGVSGREPVGAATNFHSDDLDKIYAFVELANDAKAEDQVEVVFTPTAGGTSHRVKLDVGPQARWRTWATSRKARATGAWTATVRTADGRVLASTKFEIAP